MNRKDSVTVILLAGGTGERMGSPIPKQYLPLGHQAIARYSFDCFLQMEEIAEIVVVCEEEYQHLFATDLTTIDIHFAAPGKRRQDSVLHGLNAMKEKSHLVCVHDSARPFINPDLVVRTIDAAKTHGAAALAVPVKSTIKEANAQGLVTKTLNRNCLWEMQTPQVIKTELLKQAFDYVIKYNIEVTDDLSLIEIMGHPTKLVESDYINIKITTPDDLELAIIFLERHNRLQQLVQG